MQTITEGFGLDPTRYKSWLLTSQIIRFSSNWSASHVCSVIAIPSHRDQFAV
jgi:hypothetical protein